MPGKLPAIISKTTRALMTAEYQKLADVPPELEWFANINKRLWGL